MLTPKQEQYCKNRAIKRMSQRKAYIDAFPSAKNWKPETVDNKAYILERGSEILARIKELQDDLKKEMLKEEVWTRKDAFKTLNKLIAKAEEEIETRGEMSSPNVSAIINAVKELNGIFDVTGETTEQESYGFIDALNSEAAGVWDNEENGDIPI